MRKYAGRSFVVKYGGHVMGNAALSAAFARDIVLLKQVGIHPIVVHGGGPQIGEMLGKLDIKTEFIDGLRVSDEKTVEVAEMVLAGRINKEVVSAINAAGGTAVGLTGKDGKLITARRVSGRKRDPGSAIEKLIDIGLVGEPSHVDTGVLDVFRKSDLIPVIAPIGQGEDGATYNMNADTVAGAIAGALRSARMFLLTDVAGVLDKSGVLLTDLNAAKVNELIGDGTISGGMIPKISTCLDAVAKGVEAAVIIDGRVPHALLLEIFTARGFGTLVSGTA
ncbi:MAG: acetylglutamate kinase [Pseudomonadota bacterium]